MSDWQPAGPHRYRVEGDFVLWESHGPVAPEHAHIFAQLMLRIGTEHGRAYCITDGRDMQPVPAASRRIYLEYIKRHKPCFVLAIYGAPLPIRVAGMLVVHAARVLSLPPLHVRYTSTEEEARAYLDEQRQAVAGRP